MPSRLDAFEEPPEVRRVGDEIVVTGPLVNAAYSLAAARGLVARLQAALADGDAASRPAD